MGPQIRSLRGLSLCRASSSAGPEQNVEKARAGTTGQGCPEQSAAGAGVQGRELTGATLAPRNEATLEEFRRRRLQEQQAPIPEEVINFVPEQELELDSKLFAACLRSAPSGSSFGPGGCTNEILHVCLDDREIVFLVTAAAQDFGAAVQDTIFRSFMLTSMTALNKRDGGVRGTATKTVFRRMVAKTLARQFSKEVEDACAPFQFALSTRAGVDCVGHAVRVVTDAVLSVDGIGAYDHVSRASMLSKLLEVPRMLPFVHKTCASPPCYKWADPEGHTHEIWETSKAIPSCNFCLVWQFTTRSLKSKVRCKKVSSCSRSSMTCTSLPGPPGRGPSEIWSRIDCTRWQGSNCIKAKPESGTERVRVLQTSKTLARRCDVPGA